MHSWLLRYLLLALLMFSSGAFAEQQIIPLWPGIAPGSEAWTHHEVMEVRKKPPSVTWTPVQIRNVVRPTLTVYEPSSAKRTGAAVIVCPGGGGIVLDWTREGTNVAQALAARGVTAFLLKYRVQQTPQSEAEYQAFAKARRSSPNTVSNATAWHLDNADLLQAIKIVRRRAADWQVDPNRIGIMGFSHGGGMVIDVALEHDADTRPDFVAAIYGGETNGRALPKDVPPLFTAAAQHDDEDAAADMTNLFLRWHTANVPAELHIFTAGATAKDGRFATVTPELPLENWIDAFAAWLTSQMPALAPRP